MLRIKVIEFFLDCKEGNITMKSISLLFLILTSLSTSVALAQMTTMPPKSSLESKSSFEKFSDRLRIGYFGVLTTPHLDDMEKGQWRNAAISPEFGLEPKGENKNRDTWPTNVWHQISFNYNFGAKMNFVFNPRFMTPLAHGRDMEAPEDRSLIEIEDFFFGFQGVVFSSDDKKFNLFLRPGMRLPTSRASRNSGNGGFGASTHQIELGFLPTYDFNSKWQLGVFGQIRNWVYDDRYNYTRTRFYTAPFVQYTIDDKSLVQVYYENMIENFRRWESINDKKPVFKDVWQNVMVGYSRDVTSRLNLMPFASVFVNDKPVTDKSIWFGAWISYKIK